MKLRSKVDPDIIENEHGAEVILKAPKQRLSAYDARKNDYITLKKDYQNLRAEYVKASFDLEHANKQIAGFLSEREELQCNVDNLSRAAIDAVEDMNAAMIKERKQRKYNMALVRLYEGRITTLYNTIDKLLKKDKKKV